MLNEKLLLKINKLKDILGLTQQK